MLVKVVLVLKQAWYFGHDHVCLGFWHWLVKRFDVLWFKIESGWGLLGHIEEVSIQFIKPFLGSSLLESTWLASTTEIGLALGASSAVELKFVGESCSCLGAHNRLELWLNCCLFLLEVLVRCVLYSSYLRLVKVVVVVITLHLLYILVSIIERFLLLLRLAVRLVPFLIFRLDVNSWVLHLGTGIGLLILVYFRLADLGVVGWLLELVPLTSVIWTIVSSSQIEQILFVMFISTNVVLLSWLHYVLLKRLVLKFILCLNIL